MQARMRSSLPVLLLLAACIERPWNDVKGRAVDRSALSDVLLQAPPAGTIPVGAVFGGQAELVGYKLDPLVLVAGQRATLLLVPLAAAAHQQSLSTSEIVARGERLEVRLHFATADLASLLPIGTRGEVTQAELDRVLPALVRLTLEGLSIGSREGPCSREKEARTEPEGPDGVVVEGAYRCLATPDLLRVRVRFV